MASINASMFQCGGEIVTAETVRKFFSENPSFLGGRTSHDIERATDRVIYLINVSGKKLDLGAYYVLLEHGIKMVDPKEDVGWTWDDFFIPHNMQRGKKIARHPIDHNPKKQRLVA
jgi:hypothetical protein